MSDEQRLAEIRSRAEAATPGPWRLNVPGGEGITRYVLAGGSDDSRIIARLVARTCHQSTDAAFVAHAREDVPYLLALVADLQRVVADLCEESDAAAEAMRLRAVLERIAHPKTGRDVWVKLIAEEALRGRDDGKAT